MVQKGETVLHIIAHDIRSRENVGAIFRTCEFLGVSKLWLAGYTPAPPDPKLVKVALGAEKSVEWEKVTDVRTALDRLSNEGFRIVGLELTKDAIELAEYDVPSHVAILLGNEVTGVPPSLLAECDDVVMIGRQGKKESLNVAIATGIAAHWMLS